MTSILENLSILQTLTEQEKDSLAIFCQERYLQKGEILFSEGDEGNAMYFLKSGKIDIYKEINGNEEKIGQVVAEEVLGEMALFQSQSNKRMGTAIAAENSMLIVILDFSIDELKRKHPNVIEKIKQVIEYRNSLNVKYNTQF
ncbi:MAG: cyclic nucleotide-binding domain-containing protein [Candidatus Gracilibacteria bacterium]|nr:cyclic nucleotide-binding domain-containing protein [Candidatus Gracilibacteria bacterium]